MAQVEDNGEKDVAEGGGGGGSGDEKKEEGDRKEEYNGGEPSEEGKPVSPFILLIGGGAKGLCHLIFKWLSTFNLGS